MERKKKTFNGRSPRNARIKIDYSGKQPDVKFSYPRGRHGYVGSMQGAVMSWCWCIFFMILFIGVFFTNGVLYIFGVDLIPSQEDTTPVYMNRNITFEDNNQTLIVYTKTNLTLQEEMLSGRGMRRAVLEDFKYGWICIIITLFGFIIIPCFVYYTFKKQWDSLYPKYQAWSPFGGLKYMKFEAKDVKGDYVEVPLFQNVVLKYNAKGDFSKHLDWMEIEEYKFQYLKGSKLKNKERNEWMWYCRFYLKEKPKNGSLEVWFK